ncbi:hypothetical protein HpNP99_13150 [Helicobacter pylori]
MMRAGSQPDTTICYKILKLLDYDFLLLLNDESGKPARYYYLLQDFEKDFVASKVAQNRAKRFVKEIIGSKKASKN